MLIRLFQTLARCIVATAAFCLLGLALAPVGKKITYGPQEKESRFAKDFKVRGAADDRSDEAQVLLLFLIINDAVRAIPKLKEFLPAEAKEKKASGKFTGSS